MTKYKIKLHSQGRVPLINIKELLNYKELLWTFVERNLKVRYKQTVIGGFWAILQPFMTMVVFSFFFGKIAKIPSDGVPYPLFSYSGLILWTYFSNALTLGMGSMLGSANLISKVYFPRIIIPVSATLTGILDYLVAFSIVFGLLLFYHHPLNWQFILFPVILVFTWLLATGISFWTSAINVKYRDMYHVLPFFIQLFVFITPVIYPTSVAGQFKWLVTLNPMTGLIETHRALILGQPINLILLCLSILMTIVILFTGLIYFKSVERQFADII